MIPAPLLLRNGTAVERASIPGLSNDEFPGQILDHLDRGWRVSAFFGLPQGELSRLYCLLAAPSGEMLGLISTSVGQEGLPSLTPLCPQLHLFEREITEQLGVAFYGHPWPKPVRFQSPLRRPLQQQGEASPMTGVMDYYRVEGESVHEVAVGPVHAGIIEPGHFRFQCYGEQVFHLEICLGYQHRGVEQLLLAAPHPLTLARMETVAGDTTIGHGWAYTLIREALAGVTAPQRAQAVRALALELERLANHTGDLGAVAGDVGYLPTASFCGRLRGEFLNLTAELCGSRFGRGLLLPGGVAFDCTRDQAQQLLTRLGPLRRDLTEAVELLWETPSVMGRLENTGTVSRETALELGLVGPAARACGLSGDIRRDHPWGIYATTSPALAAADGGDVHARARVRWQEIQASLDYITTLLEQLPDGELRCDCTAPAPDRLAVALTEGWRGEICHVALTDDTGRFAAYKIVDPSFHNWQGLAMALRGQQISDFPLCNKSFNLSYCGFDL